METRVSSRGIAALLLQQHPGKPRTWMPVASWGHCLEPLEKMESCILLQLKALREGAWIMGKFTAFFPKPYYAGHTRVVGLVEGFAEGTPGAPGDAD